MELVVEIEDSKIDAIIKTLDIGRKSRPKEYKNEITPYWEHHLAQIRIERFGKGKLLVAGESGFYFPGMTYSGLDFLNTVFKRFGLMRTIAGSEYDLSIPQYGTKKFGYKIMGKWTSSDYLRSIHHAKKIITQTKLQSVSLPDKLRILEIGSGTGIQALVFKQLFKNATYFLVDFPETLALAAVFLGIVCPEAKVLYYDEWKENTELLKQDEYDFVFVPNYAVSKMPDNIIHLGINTVSMQEMNYHTIEMYFKELRRVLTAPSLFYQCNRDKKMDGVMIEVSKYPYIQEDEHIYSDTDAFHACSIVMKRFLGRFKICRKFGMPVFARGTQVSYFTKMAKQKNEI